MDQNKQIPFDSAIAHVLGQHPIADGSDYTDFLNRLSDHNKNTVLLDQVLEQKLAPQIDEPIGAWRKIIAIVWLRRAKNLVIILLFAVGSMIGLQYLLNNTEKKSETNTFLKNKRKSAIVNIPQNETKTKEINSIISVDPTSTTINNNNSTPAKSIIIQPTHPTLDLEPINNSESYINHTDELLDEELTMFEMEGEPKLTLCGLKKFNLKDATSTQAVTLLTSVPQSSSGTTKRTFFERIPKTGLTIGLRLGSSFQNYYSEVTADPKTVNRNYQDLSNSGRERSVALNYGFFIEKNIIKGFGLAIGVNKLTLKQQQTTNYTLTEAPVFNLDGNIAGYISIPPENIQTTISNRMDFVMFPINLMYGFALTPKNSLQLKVGSSLLCELNNSTQKFDYSSLLLNNYEKEHQQLSMNNFQYSIGYCRQLHNHVMLSFEYEKQMIHKVNALSDPTEKNNAVINNFNISLKYKL